jgi:hypothetical protein
MGQLHDRMAQDLVLRNLSPATARNYLLYGRKFAAFFGRSPAELGEAEVRQFLLRSCRGGQRSRRPHDRPVRPGPAAAAGGTVDGGVDRQLVPAAVGHSGVWRECGSGSSCWSRGRPP